MIRREIDIHSKLKHENIVELYTHHEDKDNFYLIMEYVDSGSLFDFISVTKGVDEKAAFQIFVQVASSILLLHKNQFVHRDIKPENLLMDSQGRVKLCDFGWCADASQGQRETFCGTYEYMAPELVKEIPYSYCIDIWSLGILLYELTHGFSPFRAKTEGNEEYLEIFRNILKYNFKLEKDDLSDEYIDLIRCIYNY
jgi:serine/threonine protein kinase